MASPLTIRSIRARPLALPLRKQVETASGTLTTAPLVLVDVRTEEDITGCAYASIYSPLALEPLARLIENLAELLASTSAEPAAAESVLERHFKLLGLQGLTGIAIATVDMALWDAQAKAAGLPLARLLGGEVRPIPAYASLGKMTARAAAADAAEALALGFTAFKVKVGRSDLAADLETIRAVREAIGPDTELMVDYNQALPVEEAIHRGRQLDAEGLAWIEEPTRADDWWGVTDMEKSIAARASQHVMFDAMKIGGVSGWLRAARLARASALPVSTHVFPEFSAHLLAATPTAHRLEYVDKVGPILTNPVEVVAGQVSLSDRPGAGIEWDERAIRQAAGS
ncbi:MAG: enolase C-terminal domain-like protein [Streptosporangiales bacterium]